MASKQQIVDSIAAVARRLGRAPSRSEFISASGISEYYISLFFATWPDAVTAAGFQVCNLNVPIDDRDLLKDWAESARKNRSLPSRRAYRRLGKYDLRTLERRFGSWSTIPRAFADFAKGKPEWADVVAMLPAVPANRREPKQLAPPKERGTYGNPLNFRQLRHEPVNEQGVVLLFGMLAEELGFAIEAVRNEFPDCEAKRRISPQRWQRVLIEFEFESKNFRDHGHSPTGCDIIVCWRHNWDECPEQIEIVELSRMIKSSTGSDN